MQGIESLDKFKNFVSSIGGLGRYEDTYIVHAAEGETVVPMEVLDRNPVLKERLFESMRDMGIEPERYVVGNELNSINPITGQPEFFLKKIFRRLRKAKQDIGRRLRKAAADASGYVAPIVGAMYGPAAGAAAGAFLGQYKRENPGDPNQALKMAIRGGISGLGSNIATGQGTFGGTGLSGAYGTANPISIGKQFLGMGEFVPGETVGGIPGTGTFTTPGRFVSDPSGKMNILEGLQKTFMKPGGTGFGDLKAVDSISNLVNQFGLNPASTVESAAQTEGGKNFLLNFFKGKSLPLILAAYGTKSLGDAIKEEQEEARRREQEAERDFNRNLSSGPIEALLREVELVNVPPAMAAQGGVMDLRQGGESEGPGTGTSDDIPAMLSDGEFVMTAKAVRGAGGGDRREGARKMYQMMDELEARA